MTTTATPRYSPEQLRHAAEWVRWMPHPKDWFQHMGEMLDQAARNAEFASAVRAALDTLPLDGDARYEASLACLQQIRDALLKAEGSR